MAKKTKPLFYVRIDFINLLDFATDPIGKKMSLLSFAKELMKESSEIPQIQRIINEAHRFILQKKEAGLKSAKKRKEEKERLEKEATALNSVATVLNDVATKVNGPPTNNSNSTAYISKGGLSLKERTTRIGFAFTDGKTINVMTGEENPFGYTEEPLDD